MPCRFESYQAHEKREVLHRASLFYYLSLLLFHLDILFSISDEYPIVFDFPSIRITFIVMFPYACGQNSFKSIA